MVSPNLQGRRRSHRLTLPPRRHLVFLGVRLDLQDFERSPSPLRQKGYPCIFGKRMGSDDK
jgi:hypothetical protein